MLVQLQPLFFSLTLSECPIGCQRALLGLAVVCAIVTSNAQPYLETTVASPEILGLSFQQACSSRSYRKRCLVTVQKIVKYRLPCDPAGFSCDARRRHLLQTHRHGTPQRRAVWRARTLPVAGHGFLPSGTHSEGEADGALSHLLSGV